METHKGTQHIDFNLEYHWHDFEISKLNVVWLNGVNELYLPRIYLRVTLARVCDKLPSIHEIRT